MVIDIMTIVAWRSETIKALAARTEYKNARSQVAQEITNSLFLDIGTTFPLLFDPQRSMANFHDQVMVPAASLAVKMQSSASTYGLLMPKKLRSKLSAATTDHLRKSKLVEVETGKVLKPDCAVVARNNGVIGEQIIVLEPSLNRTYGNEDAVVLRKSMVLVELLHPLGTPHDGLA